MSTRLLWNKVYCFFLLVSFCLQTRLWKKPLDRLSHNLVAGSRKFRTGHIQSWWRSGSTLNINSDGNLLHFSDFPGNNNNKLAHLGFWYSRLCAAWQDEEENWALAEATALLGAVQVNECHLNVDDFTKRIILNCISINFSKPEHYCCGIRRTSSFQMFFSLQAF